MTIGELASWWAYVLWFYAKTTPRKLWDELPGPRWVKFLLMGVIVAMLVTPGPDELLVPALAAGVRAWRTRRSAR